MKPAIVHVLLLAPALAFAQKFQDVTAKGAPVSLAIKNDRVDLGPYIAVHNKSNKGTLAYVAVTTTTDGHGKKKSCRSIADYAFKSSVLRSQEENPLPCPMEPETPGAKVIDVVCAVLFVQFEDGTTWGDREAGKEMLGDRPKKVAFLKRLVETYYKSGENAFNAILNDRSLEGTEWLLAMMLKGADTPAIDLAKKQLAAAQGWHASGIF